MYCPDVGKFDSVATKPSPPGGIILYLEGEHPRRRGVLAVCEAGPRVFGDLLMKGGCVVLLACGVLALDGAPLLAQPRRGDPQAARYGWLASLADGQAQARLSGKPLLVVLRCLP